MEKNLCHHFPAVMLLFPKALKKDKAYLATRCLPAISTIRRQQEASQALAFSASGGDLSSRVEEATWRCYLQARFRHE